MALGPGSKLGVYEVTAKIGAGGMGEVFRAHDTTLDRDVAIKVLPDAFANDPERLARFEREAKVLASLNHPNIAAIYGLEKSQDTRALILELVEGPTLQDRIAKGPIPLDEALPIARQIAEALEAAHEQGIIHRDLKPANVKVKDDGTVKVLDFGLAKALAPDLSDLDAANSPTMTMTAAATKMGVIMGTAAYMAPEQARGKPVDKRIDIWAFGVVLFEMLTGQQLFSGPTVSDSLAKVLERQPDFNALPARTPAPIRRVLRRCLEKDRHVRLQHVGDARIDITEALAAPAIETPETAPGARHSVWQRSVPAVTASLAMAAITGLAVWSLMRPGPRPLTRFTIPLPEAAQFPLQGDSVDLSPDGRTLAFAACQSACGDPSNWRVYRRPLDELDPVPIPSTEGADTVFFSPDGQWVGFHNALDRSLEKVSLTGGTSVTLGQAGEALHGASWGTDDAIVFSPGGSGLWRVSATGGEPQELTIVKEGEQHWWPHVLPGGRAVLFTVWRGSLETAEVGVVSLETGEQRSLVDGNSPRYAPSGHLVFAQERSLWAVGFDLARLEVTGSPVPVLEDVEVRATASSSAQFTLAGDGSLVYIPAGSGTALLQNTLVWVDREGREELVAADAGAYYIPRLSPDGSAVAIDVTDPENRDVWIYDLARDTMTRLTFDPEFDTYPVWTQDGSRVFTGSRRAGGARNLFLRAADGTGQEERLTTTPQDQIPLDVSPDGKSLIFWERGSVSGDIGVLSLDAERQAELILRTEFNERNAALSPDGRWLAYQSDESGQWEIYVRPFPNVDDGKWQVSQAGGAWPAWAPSSREVFYWTGEGLMAVTIETDPTFRPTSSELLFEDVGLSRGFGRTYDVSPDGQQFLIVKAGGQGDASSAPAQIVVVLNWFEELQARVPTGR